MQASDFEALLLSYVKSEPFSPVVVEMRDGSQIRIDEPGGVAFKKGSAAYINSEGEINLFDYHGVRAMHLETPVAR